MKKNFYWIILFATILFAACGGDDYPTNPPFSKLPAVKIIETSEECTSITVKMEVAVVADYFAYIIEPHTEVVPNYTPEELFSKGNVNSCDHSGKVTFTINNLHDSTLYDIHLCTKSSAGLYSDVLSTTIWTMSLTEFTILSQSPTQIKVAVQLPNGLLPSSSVVKWSISDLATYNHNGGNSNYDAHLSLYEAVYENFFTVGYDFDISNDNRIFTKNGVEFERYETLQPGQPMVLLLSEYGEGAHLLWGDGYYTPLFENGYFRKRILFTTKPTALATKPVLRTNMLSTGEGSVSITLPDDANELFYTVVDRSQYAEIVKLLDNDESLLPWFTSSAFAAKHYNVMHTENKSNIINTEYLNLKTDVEYYLLANAWGEGGLKQSFASLKFTLVVPPAAPVEASNNIIAIGGGTKEAGQYQYPYCSIASLKYAMSLGCYASEADIHWTKDNQIIVAHADINGKINELYPWENTLEEIQAAGKLSNGETIPSLEDYLSTVMVNGSCTKLCLHVEAITKPKPRDAESLKACERACEIIVEMGAQKFCEMICAGDYLMLTNCVVYAKEAGIDIGAMGSSCSYYLLEYQNMGYRWHHHDKKDGLTSTCVKYYIGRPKSSQLSLGAIDNDDEWREIESFSSVLRGITTNYPKKLIQLWQERYGE